LSAKKALVAALCAVVALAGLALFVPIDAPGLGRELQERVRSSTGIPLEISRTRFRLLRGLLLEEVRASSSFVSGGYQVHVPRLILEHRLLPLLSGRLEATGVMLEKGRIDWAGGSVSVEGLALTLSRLDYDSRAITPLHGLGADALVALRRSAFESWELRELAARIATEGGRVRMEGLRFETDRGAFSGEAALDFNSLPFRYRGSVVGSPFELVEVGRGTLRLEAEGFGATTRNLQGKGSFALPRGRLPDAPWIRAIDPGLAGAEHSPVDIPFEVRDERVYFERLEIESSEGVLDLEGSLGLDGSRDLRATVTRRRD